MSAILAALMRTITETADSKKAVSSLVASIFTAVSSMVTIEDPQIRGIVIALSTAIITGSYVIAQAIADRPVQRPPAQVNTTNITPEGKP